MFKTFTCKINFSVSRISPCLSINEAERECNSSFSGKVMGLTYEKKIELKLFCFFFLEKSCITIII